MTLSFPHVSAGAGAASHSSQAHTPGTPGSRCLDCLVPVCRGQGAVRRGDTALEGKGRSSFLTHQLTRSLTHSLSGSVTPWSEPLLWAGLLGLPSLGPSSGSSFPSS